MRMRICVSTRDLAPMAGTPFTRIFMSDGKFERLGQIVLIEVRVKDASFAALDNGA